MLKELSKLHRNEKGITGLETAIILIAFVVVASVFAYTVLSAGVFSAQKGQEAISGGLRTARGSMELRGDVLGYTGTVSATSTVVKIAFTVANAVGGEPVDLTPPYTATVGVTLTASGLDHVTLVSYKDKNQFINDAAWTVTFVGKNNGDYLLETNEKAVITVYLANYNGSTYSLGGGTGDPFVDDLAKVLTTYQNFTLEVKPPAGSVLAVERTLPGRLDTVMTLR